MLSLQNIIEKFPEIKEYYETFYYEKFSKSRSSWDNFPLQNCVEKLSVRFYSTLSLFHTFSEMNFDKYSIELYLQTIGFTPEESEAITLIMLFKIDRFISVE